MKRFFRILLYLSMVFLPLQVVAADLSAGEKDTLFISEVKVLPAVAKAARNRENFQKLKHVSETLGSQFVTAVSGTRIFQLVERQHLDEAFEEQEMVKDGEVDTEGKFAAQTGKMLGARFVLIPVIDGFEMVTNNQQQREIGRHRVSRDIFLSAMIKVVDTTTGELLPDAPSVRLNKSEAKSAKRGKKIIGEEELLVEIANEAATKLSQAVIALLRPARVLTVTGKQVLINRGEEAGFAVGDLVEILSSSGVRDDETGETYRNEVPVGQAKIVRSDKRQSIAMIDGDDLGITVGCVVKIFKKAAVDDDDDDDDTSESAGVTPGSSEKPLKWQ